LIEYQGEPIVNPVSGVSTGNAGKRKEKMSILSAFSRYIAGYRALRARRATERLISSLPPEIRKDIGWPGCYPPHCL
jgi:hypothetical protein